jgi:predicted ester cyclase
MSTETNIAVIRRLINDGFSAGDLAVVDELVAPDSIEHQRGSKPGADGARDTIRTLHAWFSEFHLEILDLVADGETVWIRNRATGINTGSVMGRPPTGKAMDITVIDIVRFADGRIVEHWGVPDQLGMLMQIGLFGRPEPGTAATDATRATVPAAASASATAAGAA